MNSVVNVSRPISWKMVFTPEELEQWNTLTAEIEKFSQTFAEDQRLLSRCFVKRKKEEKLTEEELEAFLKVVEQSRERKKLKAARNELALAARERWIALAAYPITSPS